MTTPAPKNGLDAMAEAQGRRSVNEYRCTRRGAHHHNESQGTYVLARDEDHARKRMAEIFPNDDPDKVHAELWLSYDREGRVEYHGVLRR